MDDGFISVAPDMTLSEAIPLFGEESALLVFEGKKFRGEVRARDVLCIHKNPDNTKISSVMRFGPRVSENTRLREAARLMADNNILLMPVMEGDKVQGVIRADSIIEAAIEGGLGKLRVKEIMRTDVETARPDEKLSSLINRLRWNLISEMPVLQKDSLVGIVKTHSVVKKAAKARKRPRRGFVMDEKNRILSLPISNFITPCVAKVREEDMIKTANSRMRRNKVNVAVVMSGSKLKGCISKRDLLIGFASIPGDPNRPMIQIGSRVKKINRVLIRKTIKEHLSKNPNLYGNSFFEVYIGERKESFRKQIHDKLYANLRIYGPKGRYFAIGDGWGERNAVVDAFRKIEKQIEKRLDLSSLANKKVFPRTKGFREEDFSMAALAYR